MEMEKMGLMEFFLSLARRCSMGRREPEVRNKPNPFQISIPNPHSKSPFQIPLIVLFEGSSGTPTKGAKCSMPFWRMFHPCHTVTPFVHRGTGTQHPAPSTHLPRTNRKGSLPETVLGWAGDPQVWVSSTTPAAPQPPSTPPLAYRRPTGRRPRRCTGSGPLPGPAALKRDDPFRACGRRAAHHDPGPNARKGTPAFQNLFPLQYHYEVHGGVRGVMSPSCHAQG